MHVRTFIRKEYSTVVEYYSPGNDTWIMSKPYPMKCFGHAAVAISGKFFEYYVEAEFR